MMQMAAHAPAFGKSQQRAIARTHDRRNAIRVIAVGIRDEHVRLHHLGTGARCSNDEGKRQCDQSSLEFIKVRHVGVKGRRVAEW